jgi:hypothetical protein
MESAVTVLKVILTSLFALFAVAVVTYAYAVRAMGAAKAIGVEALLALTVQSPVYWFMVAVVLAAIWLLFRGWFVAGR